MEKLHYIKDEMLSHIPICTHADPKSILIVGGCDNLYGEVVKHNSIDSIMRLSADEAAQSITTLDESSFDIIIVATDKFAQDRVFWGFLNRILASDGIVATQMSTILSNEQSAERELESAGELFKIVMPYRYESLDKDGHPLCKNLLIASHHYHPTADINLQRADLTEGYNYYNSDIAIGTFALPTVIRRRFAGLIKL